MTETVFVLIKTNYKDIPKIYHELNAISEVEYAYGLMGEYDFIAKVSDETQEAIGKVVIEKIRNVEGIETTSSMIVMSKKNYDNM